MSDMQLFVLVGGVLLYGDSDVEGVEQMSDAPERRLIADGSISFP